MLASFLKVLSVGRVYEVPVELIPVTETPGVSLLTDKEVTVGFVPPAPCDLDHRICPIVTVLG